ncbi:CAP domain-containing protein, partial [Candidatus Parvarchaeota archaeon]|nr:CAP domain-containing protein [Candidatus Parvarchaeota archaeon]
MGLEIWKYAAIAFFIVSLGLATVLALGTLEVRQEYKCPKQAACQEESAGKLGKCAASLEKCSGKRVAADERIALLERQNLQLSQGIANLTKQLAQKNGQGAIEEGGEGARVAQKELNLTRLRQEAQDAINAQRQAYNSTPVGQNDILNSLAQKCSDFILRTENFAHKSCAQEFGEVHARVVDAGVHSVVTFEDLSTGPIEWYVSGEGIIQGYLDSPSHRSSIVDLDGLTNKVGVGVSCTQSKCVNSIILSGTKTKKTGSLGPKYETWFPLVNEGFGFSKNP